MTVRLPYEVHEQLRRDAFYQRRSMNELVIEALRRSQEESGDNEEGNQDHG